MAVLGLFAGLMGAQFGWGMAALAAVILPDEGRR